MRMSTLLKWGTRIGVLAVAVFISYVEGRGALQDTEYYQLVFRFACDESCVAMSDKKPGDPFYKARMIMICEYERPFVEREKFYQFYWDDARWGPVVMDELLAGPEGGEVRYHYDYIDTPPEEIVENHHPVLNTELEVRSGKRCPVFPVQTYATFAEQPVKNLVNPPQ